MKLTKKFRLIYNYKNEVVNNNDYKIELNEGSETEFLDSFLKGFESNSLKQIERFIKENNLILPEGTSEVNPFYTLWDLNYPSSKIRLFMPAFDRARLAIDKPEFVLYLKQSNINLIADEVYEVVWAYLEYILPEHLGFLEMGYNARFECKNI